MSMPRLQVPLAHGLMMSTSLGILCITALVLRHTLPDLPAQILMHFQSGQPDRLAPPSELWVLWWVMLGVWIFLALLALAMRNIRGLNVMMPVLSAEEQPRVRLEIRGMMLAMQIITTLIGCGLLLSFIVRGLGGPNMEGLALLPLAGIPVTLGYFLYRISVPPSKVN